MSKAVQMEEQHPELVSEAIDPVPGSFDAGDMGRGLAGLPRAFSWRGQRFEVAEVLGKWKESGPEIGRFHGEQYLRRHYFRVRTVCGSEMVLYCERKARSATSAKRRWWLYTFERPGGE